MKLAMTILILSLPMGLLTGCVTTSSAPSSVRHRSVIWSSPSRRAISIDLKANAEVTVLNSREFIVAGDVQGSSIEYKISRKGRWSDERHYSHNEDMGTVQEPFQPKYVNFGQWEDIPVSSDGTFSRRFTLSKNHYFKFSPREYVKVNEFYRDYSVWIASVGSVAEQKRTGVPYLGSYHRIEAQTAAFPTVYRPQYDKEEAKAFARGMLLEKAEVSIDFKEQVTRVVVSPSITITPIDAPHKDDYIASLKESLKTEFDEVSVLVDAGMEEIERRLETSYGNVLWGGQDLTDRAQHVSFSALVDCKYKIETVHGEYNYFRGFIEPSSSADIK